MDDGVRVPLIWIGVFSVRRLYALAIFVCGRSENAIFPQNFCDLQRSATLNTHIKNVLDYARRLIVNKPFCTVGRVFYVAIWYIHRQRYTSRALSFINGSDFAAGILCEELVSQPFIKNDGL